MPEIQRKEEPVLGSTVCIAIGNRSPIDAEELGRLVRDLGADYRRATGGRLVLTRIEFGSTFIWLQDAAVVTLAIVGGALTIFDAIERMSKYYGYLKDYLKNSPKTTEDHEVSFVALSGSRLLDVAAKHHASLEIFRDLPNGQEKIKLTFPEVSSANARVKERKKKNRQKRSAKPNEQFEVTEYARQLSDSAPIGSGPSEIEGVVEAIAGIIKASGMEHLLLQIAQALEGLGRWDLARVVRRHIDEGKGRALLSRD